MLNLNCLLIAHTRMRRRSGLLAHLPSRVSHRIARWHSLAARLTELDEQRPPTKTPPVVMQRLSRRSSPICAQRESRTGRKNERLNFDTVDPYASPYIQALGVREEVSDGTPKRVGITVGPQYGTVGPAFIKDAAREANRAQDLDLLCVLAFAFDPAVLGTSEDYVTSEDGFANVAAERRLGRVPVLLVRMNADLVMGEELKKTGAGNLFTVFGEPDIDIKGHGDDLRVVLNGVDVYDPNTGELRSNDTDQIALWMIDTAYNGESFFVRHCYFTGGQDPYKKLKVALKAEIDEEAWASLYSTESRPFARPETGKIAVKVVNDYGDEVMKVFAV
jgi:adenine-specific DNA-methyltransferase